MDVGPIRANLEKILEHITPLILERINQSPYLTLKVHDKNAIVFETPLKKYLIENSINPRTNSIECNIYHVESVRWTKLTEWGFLLAPDPINDWHHIAYKLGGSPNIFTLKDFPDALLTPPEKEYTATKFLPLK